MAELEGRRERERAVEEPTVTTEGVKRVEEQNDNGKERERERERELNQWRGKKVRD